MTTAVATMPDVFFTRRVNRPVAARTAFVLAIVGLAILPLQLLAAPLSVVGLARVHGDAKDRWLARIAMLISVPVTVAFAWLLLSRLG